MLIRNFLNLCHLSEFLDTVSYSSSYYTIVSKNGNIIDLSNTEAGNARNTLYNFYINPRLHPLAFSCLIPSNLIIRSLTPVNLPTFSLCFCYLEHVHKPNFHTVSILLVFHVFIYFNKFRPVL